MNVFVDGSSLLRKPDGVGRYTKEICSRLKDLQILTFYDTADFEYTNLIRLPFPRRAYYALYKILWRMPVNYFMTEKPDVMIYPNFIRVPMVNNVPNILVVHDLVYLHTPQYVETRNLSFLTKYLPLSVHEADIIIAVSDTTKKDIIKNFDILPQKILVAPNAVDENKFSGVSNKQIGQIKSRYDIASEYFLFVSTIEPRKNIMGILSAYEKLGKSTPTLVLAGGDGWKNKKIKTKISDLHSRGYKIVLTGFIDDSDLPALYAGATFFIFPSHFEGFGIPILEAQAAGTPVITSNKDPMKEVAGGAALLVDPDNINEIADAMSRLYTDVKLQKGLIAKGKENIKRYTWDKSANVFKKAIQDLTQPK